MVKHVRKPRVNKLVLDVLKPNEPSIIDLGKSFYKNKNIDCVSINVLEVDKKTENVKVVIEGKDLNFNKIKDIIENQGSVIHSIDGIIVENK